MRISSETQLSLGLEEPESVFLTDLILGQGAKEVPRSVGSVLAEPSTEFPRFSTSAALTAQTARSAARLNAASVSEAEVQNLLRERQALLDKKLAGTISRRDTIRLEYVRWSLDMIEDARHGEDMDRLEAYVETYETFLNQLDDFKASLERARLRRR